MAREGPEMQVIGGLEPVTVMEMSKYLILWQVAADQAVGTFKAPVQGAVLWN
jgi:hypothetical protein